jgi:RNA polymerase sigma factor (sigma-70 family)
VGHHTIFCPLVRLLYYRKVEPLDSGSKTIGNAESIDGSVRKERKRLFDFIRRRIRNESDAEDILQDVFYQLATSYSVTEPIENLTAWLFTVARNKITDWYRKRRAVTLPVNDTETEGGGPLDLEEVLFDPRDGPDLAYWRSTVWSELAEALDELPEEQRAVFVWHELEGRSFREIAELTGERINTLLSRKRYAVLALRERLQNLYDELEIP